MSFQLSPSVQVVETDLTTVVPAVATTAGAFAGFFSWGPVNQRILIDSENNLVDLFGQPNSENAVDFFTAANFLGYGNNLTVVRAENDTMTNAGDTAGILVRNRDHYDSLTAYANNRFIAKYAGERGNDLDVAVCGAGNGTTLIITAPGSTDFIPGEEITQATTDAEGIVFSWTRLSGGTARLVIVAEDGTFNATNDITGTDSNKVVEGADIDSVAQENLFTNWTYRNFFQGAPNANEIHVVVIDRTNNEVLETFGFLSADPTAKQFDGSSAFYRNVLNNRSAFIWAGDDIDSDWESAPFPAIQGGHFILAGGAAEDQENADLITAYDLFRNAEEVDISLLLTSDHAEAVVVNAIDIATERMDCVVFVSPAYASVSNAASSQNLTDVLADRNSLTSTSYAVMDSGWKLMYDRYNDRNIWVPLNGDIAGLCVRTDAQADAWFSPAGLNRGQIRGVIRLSWNPTQPQRDQLYQNGVNPVITQSGQGTFLFGDKTLLSRPSAFDRINVRRLFIVLEKAISTAAKFSLFEFNDEFTRAQFRNLVEPFLRDVQGRRGIQDFRVVCDETNNTPQVIDTNRFVADIFVRPNRSINFIRLNMIATSSGVAFEEVGA